MEDITVPNIQSKTMQDYFAMVSGGSAPKNPEFDQGLVNFKNCAEQKIHLEEKFNHVPLLMDKTRRQY